MFVGNVIMAYSDLWSAQIAGRLLTGVGGVVVNVITSKMVMDWFAEREISTAMALFLIVALRHRGRAVSMPPVGVAEGYKTVFVGRRLRRGGRFSTCFCLQGAPTREHSRRVASHRQTDDAACDHNRSELGPV